MKPEISAVAGAVAAGWVAVTSAANYHWTNSDVSAATNAMAFADSANWLGGAVPANSVSAGDIFITNHVDGIRFLRMPDAFAFSRIYCANYSPAVLLGNTLDSSKGFDYKGSGTDMAVYCYADISLKGNAYLNRTALCGDVDAANKYTVYNSAGNNYHRLDLYATSAGEVRVNPGFTYNLALSWGEFHTVAPKGSDSDIRATWIASDGSAILYRPANVPEHTLCAGTLVTSANGELPDGTFLKRIFPDGSIELSSPVRLQTASAPVELVFAAFSPKVSQALDQLNSAADCAHAFGIAKWRESDEFIVKLRYLALGINLANPAADKRTLTLKAHTGIPGTLQIADACHQRTGVILDNCHLLFASSISGDAPAGFPAATRVQMNGVSSKARVTVSDGNATIANFTKVDGTFIKDGPGTLVVLCTNSLSNTGSVTIENGAMHFIAPSDSDTVEIATLNVKNGATLIVPEGKVLKVTKHLSIADGATIAGNGTIDAAGTSEIGNATFGSGVSFMAKQQNGEPIYSQPKGIRPSGTPAFWTAADAGVETLESDPTAVKAWRDVRGSGHLFATNVASVHPKLCVDSDNRKYIHIERNANASKNDIASTAALVWNIPLSNIRAVFAVVDLSDGGSAWLGSSPRISTHDYWRNASWAYWNQVMGGQCSSKVSGGKIFVNGESIPAFNVGLPYSGYKFEATNHRKGHVNLPMCLEFMTTGDTEADAFGFCNNEDGCNGKLRIYEYVIYTNTLTTTERLETEQYLMKKWLNANANYDRLAEVPERLAAFDTAGKPSLNVPEGTLFAIDKVSGTGTLGKSGAGTLYIEDLVDANTSVSVREGTLNLRSVKAGPGNLPAEPFVHFDASDLSTLETSTVDGRRTVTGMRDCRGDGYPKAQMAKGTSLFLNETEGVGGRTMIDFGAKESSGTMKYMLNGANASNQRLRTSVSVIGTAGGGGVLVGGAMANLTYHDQDGLYRTNTTDFASPMIAPKFNRPTGTIFKNDNTRGGRFRLNGAYVNPSTHGFSGGYDVVSLAIYDFFGSSGIGGCQYGAICDGQEFGEQILFEEALSREQISAVEAYLKSKWLGIEQIAYRGSRAGRLDVAAGAKMNICGESALIVDSVSGAGELSGPVAIADGGELAVAILENGELAAPAFSDLRLPAQGNIRFIGNMQKLPLETKLAIASGITSGDCALPEWNAIVPANISDPKFFVENGVLKTVLHTKGLRLTIR